MKCKKCGKMKEFKISFERRVKAENEEEALFKLGDLLAVENSGIFNELEVEGVEE